MAEIKVPTLGESVSEATVAQWLKKEGDPVEADEPIVELETDKVTLEVNAPEAGVISKIVAGEGDSVEVGAILGEIGAANDSKPQAAKAETPKKAEKAAPSANDDDDEEKLSPAVRKLVDEHGLDPSKIEGTGKGGRLLKEDVQNFIEEHGKYAEEAPTQAVSTHPVKEDKPVREAGEREERVRMTRLRQRISERLKEAQNTAAILTTFNEVDMGAVMDLRKEYKEHFEKKHGVKLGFMSFFVKACVNALKEIPAVNAEIDGDEIIYKNYYDLGVAVSTPQGLVVPVVRDCDSKSMAQIEKDINDVGARAREGKIQIDEMTGGTFTITNGGVFGSLVSTPILNTPQSGILGMHKIQQRPVVMPDGSIQARPMMYLALSYDHRIIDGKEAVTFLVRIKDAIEDPQRLLLDI
ncbi:MAG: 2-oxoglutarate dehydrogenase complex dihydrolipoyllysine-residue succinyltransferase [Rhodospirillales bacterium]|nr:2-oxoglutarate dehydrogenase complex dihydrolipoyllysine-residue succinyltransferase [Rhodospirillales bacterium]MCB9995063.1 2-oxoglutarate dehydrogenase complex dihydrolipoyllysine-residue succinyltransferase [Rhodospirillales bacterium]